MQIDLIFCCNNNRFLASRSRSAHQPDLLHEFTIPPLKGSPVIILSVFNNKLLVSYLSAKALWIINSKRGNLTKVTTLGNDKLCDAKWTPRGNIVYTTEKFQIVVMSKLNRRNATNTQFSCVKFISNSNDDTIYVAGCLTEVYQSIDEGVSWSLVFQLNAIQRIFCFRIIKVTSGNTDDFWKIDSTFHSNDEYFLQVYSIHKNHTASNVTVSNINVVTKDGTKVNLFGGNLSYDGAENIFLSDPNNKTAAVHVISKSGQYRCQLLSSDHIKNRPYALAVDTTLRILYVGQTNSTISAYKLKYSTEGNLMCDWIAKVLTFLIIFKAFEDGLKKKTWKMQN